MVTTTEESMNSTPRKRRPQGSGPTVWIHVAGEWHTGETSKAGWGAIIDNKTTGMQTELSASLQPSGDNAISQVRAEMTAVLKALEAVPDDSTVTIWARDVFLKKALQHGFKRNKNLDLWAELDKQLARVVLKRFHHSPLHMRRPGIVKAHRLAVAVLKENTKHNGG